MRKFAILFMLLLLAGCKASITVDVEEVKSDSENESSFKEEVMESLDRLTLKIDDFNDPALIEMIFNDYINESDLEIVTIYYGDPQGNFYISPQTELPEDYLFYERPPYKIAVSDGIYDPDKYADPIQDRFIQSVAKPIYQDNDLIGVIGIDVYYPKE